MCLASELGIETRWLPVTCPELNPVDHLWRHVKQDVPANEPTPDLDTSVGYACQYIFGLTPQQRLRKAGVLSDTFLLHKVLQEHVKLLLSKYLKLYLSTMGLKGELDCLRRLLSYAHPPKPSGTE